jgi:DHA1 family inner membrane transport protein
VFAPGLLLISAEFPATGRATAMGLFGRPLTVIRTSLGALAITLTLLVVLPGQLAVIAVVAMNVVFIQVYFGPLFAIPVAHLGVRAAGVASGFGNLCANIGGFACSYGFGILRDATGSFRPGFLTLAALCVLATALTATIHARPTSPEPDPVG